MICIESKDNNLFKETKKLKERKYRTKEGKYVIEGFRLIQEAYKANMNIEHLIINEGSEDKLEEYFSGYNINNEVCT
ncbi:MAG: TrmH family RNA methyltransferase, partial [Clostridium sp.]